MRTIATLEGGTLSVTVDRTEPEKPRVKITAEREERDSNPLIRVNIVLDPTEAMKFEAALHEAALDAALIQREG